MTVRKLWHYVSPPTGRHVRRLAAWITLAVALPRLPIGIFPATYQPLGIFSAEVFGWLCLICGIGLWGTSGRHRLSIMSRIVSVVAFVLWVTLAAATASATSRMIDLVIAYAMIGEIVTWRNE